MKASRDVPSARAPARQEGRATMAGAERYCLFDTAIGLCGIAWTESGVTKFQLPERSPAAAKRRLAALRTSADEPSPLAAQAIDEARRYFTGARVDFSPVI